MLKPAETYTHTHTTKALLVFFLVFAIIPSFAQHPRITQLIAEKQAKMEKLEKCQGTTKKLKIAGISTLGVTAVGVGANIAEAVILKDKESKIATAKEELTKQQEQKEKRECEKEGSNKEYKDGKCECKTGFIKGENGNCVKEQKQQEPERQVNTSESCQYMATDCAGYVDEVYNCIKKRGKCSAYSDMNICSDGVIGNIDNPSKEEWLKNAEKVCEENKIKKKELQNKIDDIINTCKITYQADAANPMTNTCIYNNKLVINTNFSDAAEQFLSEKKWTINDITCDNVNKRCRDSKQKINIDFNTVECADKNAKYKDGTCACNTGYIKDESGECSAVDNSYKDLLTFEYDAVKRAGNRHKGFACEKKSSTMVVCTNEQKKEKRYLPFAKIYDTREQILAAEKDVAQVGDDNQQTKKQKESGKPVAQPPVAEKDDVQVREGNQPTKKQKESGKPAAQPPVDDTASTDNMEYLYFKNRSNQCYKTNMSTNKYDSVSECSGMQSLEWRIIKGNSTLKSGNVQCGTKKFKIEINSRVSDDACVCLVDEMERTVQGRLCDQIECAMACANR